MTLPCFARVAVAALALAATSAAAQQWPSRPVRVIVTFTQGGGADTTARLVGEKLSEVWKQSVVVENRPGGSGNIGTEAAWRAAPDGYTLLLVASNHVFNVALFPKQPWNLLADFVPLGLVTSTPNLLAVRPSVPVANLNEFVTFLRKQPGKVSYATCGIATTQHLSMELIKFETKTFAVHIPYRGCAPAIVETVGGQIDIVMASLNIVLPHVRAGKLRPIAVTSAQRSPSAPEIPTVRESGVPALAGYDVEVYYGFMSPAGTPKDVATKIEADVRRVMAMPDLRQRLAQAGVDLFPATAEEMAKLMRSDLEKFRKVIAYAGIQPE